LSASAIKIRSLDLIFILLVGPPIWFTRGWSGTPALHVSLWTLIHYRGYYLRLCSKRRDRDIRPALNRLVAWATYLFCIFILVLSGVRCVSFRLRYAGCCGVSLAYFLIKPNSQRYAWGVLLRVRLYPGRVLGRIWSCGSWAPID
jgi:hypothetical protein